MSRIALFLAFSVTALAATAEDTASGTSTMYLIEVKAKDVDTAADGGQKITVIASPRVATFESREAVCLIGQQTKIDEETVTSGILLKVKLKKLGGDKVRVSGMLEVSRHAAPSDDFVQRVATAYHFARTVTIGERICLGKRQTADGFRVIELEVEQTDVQPTTDVFGPPGRE